MPNFLPIQGDDMFRNLFENSTVGMSITSLDNKLHPNNAFCEMLGFSREELYDKNWADFTHPDDINYNIEIINKILDGEMKSFRWEKRYLHKNGRVIWADIHTFLHCSSSGKPLHFISTINDITKSKTFEAEVRFQNEQLQQSNYEKDKFFTVLAHDLRSPISTFMGLAEVMAEEINTMTISEIEDISKSLFHSASNLYHLLENLLEWSILRRGNIPYQPESTPIERIINRSVEPFREIALRKNIELSFHPASALNVYCDLKMTETIFRNLLSNALKYTQAQGSVVVKTISVASGEVQFSISDTGIGMSSDLLSKLFTPQGNVGRKGTEGEVSSGLGLLISKEFIELQGGRIWVESEENKGSTFYFTLKLAE